MYRITVYANNNSTWTIILSSNNWVHFSSFFAAFVELVHSSNGTTQKGKDKEGSQDRKPANSKPLKKGGRKNVSVVPSHFIKTDVSNVKEETLIFSKKMFYFVNVPPTHSLESLHKMVAENGGNFSMNLNKSATHCIAAEGKGIKYQAAKLNGDVIHCSWVLDCCSQKRLLPLLPKYYLFISESSKKKLQDEIDEFSDSYFWDIDLADVQQLLDGINTSKNSNSIEYWKRKYCSNDKWSQFHGCAVYFHLSSESFSRTPDWKSLLGFKLRRLKVEVIMGGGRVANNLAKATHLVVLAIPGFSVDFDSLIKSFTVSERYLACKKLYVIGYKWLEESLEVKKKLQEDAYSLKPNGLQESNLEEWQSAMEMEDASRNEHVMENQDLPLPDDTEEKNKRGSPLEQARLSSPKNVKRKRGRPAGRTKKGIVGVSQPRRAPTRTQRPAKICDEASDESSSFDDDANEERMKTSEENQKSNIFEENSKYTSGVEDSKSSQMHEKAEKEFSEEGHKQEGAHSEHSCAKTDVTHLEKDQCFGRASSSEIGGRHDVQERLNPDKLEVMVDPVHAMLMDMIPSLATKDVEVSQSIPEPEMQEMPAEDQDPTTQPVKKKKVSYRDLARELLKH